MPPLPPLLRSTSAPFVLIVPKSESLIIVTQPANCSSPSLRLAGPGQEGWGGGEKRERERRGHLEGSCLRREEEKEWRTRVKKKIHKLTKFARILEMHECLASFGGSRYFANHRRPGGPSRAPGNCPWRAGQLGGSSGPTGSVRLPFSPKPGAMRHAFPPRCPALAVDGDVVRILAPWQK